MEEVLGIAIKTTAGESPWRNGLVAGHNLVLSEMLDKVKTQCHPNLTVFQRTIILYMIENLSLVSSYETSLLNKN